jgi:hypothetical protein
MGTTETIVYQALNEFKRLKLIGAQIGFMHGAVNGASWTGCSIATSTQCGQKKPANEERETNLWRGGRYKTITSPCQHGQVGRPRNEYDKAGIAPAFA